MAAWLVVLVLTNVLTLTALATLTTLWTRRRQERRAPSGDELFSAPRPAGVSARTRRLITIEVLNPIELLGSRGRVAGLAGTLAPGIGRRIVHDQIVKTLRRELADKDVVADVRLHILRPEPGDVQATATAVDAVDVVQVVEIAGLSETDTGER